MILSVINVVSKDSYGSMGLTSNGKERLPIQMLPLEKVVKIASGDDHLVFLTNTGLVYSIGNAEQGQLGRICLRSTDRNCRQGSKLMLTPTKVQFGIPRTRKITDIWAGSYCTFAKVRDTGEIYACGLNNHHQLGMIFIDLFLPDIVEICENLIILQAWKGHKSSRFQ